MMEKIKQLLKSSGLSDGAATKICESLDNHTNQLRAKFEAEFNSRLEKAKQVCLEETESHKRELSRRVQVFLETKSAAIQEHLSRLAAERDTEAVAKLEKITGITEGIEINGRTNSELKAKLKESSGVCKSLLEQRDIAVQKANRLQAIANNVMKRNRLLESRQAKAGTQSGQSNLTEGKTKAWRLDARRISGKATTTRPTLVENVVHTRQQASQKTQTQSSNGYSPRDIADAMDELP